MKIKELHVFSHQLPVKNGPYRMSNALVWSLETTLVKIVGGHIKLPEGPGLGVIPEEGIFGNPVLSFG